MSTEKTRRPSSGGTTNNGSSTATSNDSSIIMSPPMLTRRQQKSIKLIELYKQHECLWNTQSSDYCNFKLKEATWWTIADQMGRKATVENCKERIYKMRYNASLDELHRREAIYCNEPPVQKLYYADHFHFLNRMLRHRNQKHQPQQQPSQCSNKHTISATSSRIRLRKHRKCDAAITALVHYIRRLGLLPNSCCKMNADDVAHKNQSKFEICQQLRNCHDCPDGVPCISRDALHKLQQHAAVALCSECH